jgi:uncharacterized protein (TIGR02145 family)
MKNITAIIFLRFVLFVFIISGFANCKKDNNGSNNNNTPNSPVFGSFTDTRDGYVYKTVKIGNQTWFAENLRYLPSVVDPSTRSLINPYYYVYDYYGTSVNSAKNTTNYKIYGVIYNIPSACISCPSGWRLPSDTEWSTLINFLGGSSNAAIKLKCNNQNLWSTINNPNYNSSGFSGLPGGYLYSNPYFLSLGISTCWWSNTITPSGGYWFRELSASVYSGYQTPSDGMYVRCIKD